jgi:exopolysaccharide production protein ExoZ
MAAVMVVLCHSTHLCVRATALPDTLSAPNFWDRGAAGVDIFFVISGFVMAIATVGRSHGHHPARRFLERRVLRIFPMYWSMTALFLVVLLLLHYLPQLKATGENYPQISPSFIVTSLFLVPGQQLPVIRDAWTLAFECFFYLLFAIALAVRVNAVRLLTPVMLLLVLIGRFYRPDWPRLTALADPLLLEFLAGMIIGQAVLRRNHIRPVFAVLSGLTGAALLFIPGLNLPGQRVFQWGVPAILIVVSAVALEDRFGHLWPRFLLLLGDASYSLYLSHILVLYFVGRLFEYTGALKPGTLRTQDEILTVVTCLAGSIVLALLLYKGVEKPMNNALRRKLLSETQELAHSV